MRRRRKDDNAAQVKRRSTAKSKHFRYLERVLACGSLGSCGAGRLARASRAKLGRLRGIQRARALDSTPAARICSTAQPISSALSRAALPAKWRPRANPLACPAQPQKIRANSGNRVASTPRGSGVEDSSLARQAISPTQFFANYVLPNFPVTHFLSSAMKKENPRRGLLGISRKCAKLISP